MCFFAQNLTSDNSYVIIGLFHGGEIMIELKNVTKSYDGNKDIVDKLNLRIERRIYCINR